MESAKIDVANPNAVVIEENSRLTLIAFNSPTD